ncbi:MAG: hypothetical protein ACMUHB_05540 [Thermoplasmatota archaeon]
MEDPRYNEPPVYPRDGSLDMEVIQDLGMVEAYEVVDQGPGWRTSDEVEYPRRWEKVLVFLLPSIVSLVGLVLLSILLYYLPYLTFIWFPVMIILLIHPLLTMYLVKIGMYRTASFMFFIPFILVFSTFLGFISFLAFLVIYPIFVIRRAWKLTRLTRRERERTPVDRWNGLVIRPKKNLVLVGVVLIIFTTIVPAAGYFLYMNAPRICIADHEVEIDRHDWGDVIALGVLVFNYGHRTAMEGDIDIVLITDRERVEMEWTGGKIIPIEDERMETVEFLDETGSFPERIELVFRGRTVDTVDLG